MVLGSLLLQQAHSKWPGTARKQRVGVGL